jgi:subtilase family serine protease
MLRSRPRPARRVCRSALLLEELECRTLLSSTPLAVPDFQVLPQNSSTPVGNGYSPAQIRHAYGFDQVRSPVTGLTVDGSGQTIAIVDPYNDPTILSDVNTFSSPQNFNLPLFNTGNGPTLKVVNQTGGSTLPATSSGWIFEIALDVEWAHALAPGANILLVEASSNSFNDLIPAVDYARNQTGVVAVSMSWGALEFYGENQIDGLFTTPTGHLGGSSGQKNAANLSGGVTFVTAAGDWGAATLYPAVSPNVLTVGGTVLYPDSAGNYGGEIGWGPSGGGYSRWESEPSFQRGVQTSGSRTSPDVAFDAAPNPGFAVYTSTPDQAGRVGWWPVGGTSAGAPAWSALLALADQARAQVGKGSLGNAQSFLYNSSLTSDFHDITSGSNGHPAGPGYDMNTGLGTPRAHLLVSALVGISTGSSARTGTSTGTTQASTALETESTSLPSTAASRPATTTPFALTRTVDKVFQSLPLNSGPVTDEVMVMMRSRPNNSLTAGVGGTSDPEPTFLVDLEPDEMWWRTPTPDSESAEA